MHHFTSVNNTHGLEVFQTFKIEDKIQELKEVLGMQGVNLQGKGVIISVPSYDESMRSIKNDDDQLYNLQLKDAHTLAQHIMLVMNTSLVNIVTSIEQLNVLNGKVVPPHEYIIYLHEFVSAEKKEMLETLEKYNANLKHIELY